jgi:hypothetical protein
MYKMGNNITKMTEKYLKMFVKKKRIGFTMALLVAFIIVGGGAV